MTTQSGYFWLPAAPDRRIAGQLELGTRVRLDLHDNLYAVDEEAVSLEPSSVNEPVMHGELHIGRLVTLFDIRGMTFPMPFPQGSENLSVRAAVLNDQVLFDEELFKTCSVQFDYLEAWAQPPSLISDRKVVGRSHDYTFSFDTVTLGRAVVDGAAITLRSIPSGSAGTDRIDITQRCVLEIELETATGLTEIISDWINSFRDLLTVHIGRAVRVTSLYVEREGADDYEPRSPVYMAQIDTQGAASFPRPSELLNYTAPTIVMRTTTGLDFQSLADGWFACMRQHRQAIVLLCAPMYAQFIYSEHRFASTYQAIESLARKLFNGSQLPAGDHQDRVQSVLHAIRGNSDAGSHADWVERLIKHRNDKPLKEMLADLIEATGPAGALLSEKVPDFARDATRLRAAVSHGGTEDSSTIMRHHIGVILSWLVRSVLLIESGLNRSDVNNKVMQHHVFNRALDQIVALKPNPDVPRPKTGTK